MTAGVAGDNRPLREIRDSVEAYYSRVLERHGPTARGVDWQCTATQYLRLVQLLKVCDLGRPSSLNDFGCGYGALLALLAERFPDAAIDYHGVDVSPAMIGAARSLWSAKPDARFSVGAKCPRRADYSLASGVFNVRLDSPVDRWERYVESILGDLRRRSGKGFAVNFLRRKRGQPPVAGLYHSTPRRWTAFCVKELDCTTEVVANYGLAEFTLLARIGD